jgi:hypothetical protein
VVLNVEVELAAGLALVVELLPGSASRQIRYDAGTIDADLFVISSLL